MAELAPDCGGGRSDWFLNADIKYVQIEPDLKYGGVKIATVKVDPILAGVGIAYRF